jgi:hypothetical protein
LRNRERGRRKDALLSFSGDFTIYYCNKVAMYEGKSSILLALKHEKSDRAVRKKEDRIKCPDTDLSHRGGMPQRRG